MTADPMTHPSPEAVDGKTAAAIRCLLRYANGEPDSDIGGTEIQIVLRALAALTTRLSAETARADKAEAEAKALREALEDGYKMLAQAFSRIHALPRSSDTALAEQIGQTRARIETALARATLAQPADGGK